MKKRPETIESFIGSSKDETLSVRAAKSIPIPKELKIDLEEKPKKFLLTIPPEIHKKAVKKASKQFPKISLHDYILVALKEKVEKK